MVEQNEGQRLQPGDPGFTRGSNRNTTTYYGLRQSKQATGEEAHETAERLKKLSASQRTQKSALQRSVENTFVGKLTSFFKK
jgi:hypothetical protein